MDNSSRLQLKVKRAKVLAGILAQSRPLTGPRYVLFRINHTCNMKCDMCASFSELVPEEFRIQSRNDMTFELYQRLIDECAAMDVEHVSVGGEGEPALHPRWVDMMQYAKDRGLNGTTITNGSKLTPEVVKRLVDMRWDELNVSMNAGNRDTHVAVTHTKTWDRIRDGLIRMAELKREQGHVYPKVRQSNTIFNSNYRSIVDMVRFAIETSADEMTVGLATLDDYPGDGRPALALTPEEFQEARVLLAEAADLADTAPGLQTNVRAFLDTIDNESAQLRITESVQLSIPCSVGYWLCVIDPDGAVHPCCQCEDSLGDAGDGGTLRQVWYSDTYSGFRRAAKALPERGKSLDNCTCHSCDFTPANIDYYNKLHPLKKVGERVSPRR